MVLAGNVSSIKLSAESLIRVKVGAKHEMACAWTLLRSFGQTRPRGNRPSNADAKSASVNAGLDMAISRS